MFLILQYDPETDDTHVLKDAYVTYEQAADTVRTLTLSRINTKKALVFYGVKKVTLNARDGDRARIEVEQPEPQKAPEPAPSHLGGIVSEMGTPAGRMKFDGFRWYR